MPPISEYLFHACPVLDALQTAYEVLPILQEMLPKNIQGRKTSCRGWRWSAMGPRCGSQYGNPRTQALSSTAVPPIWLSLLGVTLQWRSTKPKAKPWPRASRGFLIQMPCCDNLVPLSSGPVSCLQALHGRSTDSFGKLLGWELSPWQPLDRHPHPSSLPPGEGWGPSLIWMDTHLFSFMKDRLQWSFPFSFCFLRLTELENVHAL